MTAFVHSSPSNPHPGSRVGWTEMQADTELAEVVWKLHGLLVKPVDAHVDVRRAKRRLLQVLQATTKQPLPQMLVAPLGGSHGRKKSREELLPPAPISTSG